MRWPSIKVTFTLTDPRTIESAHISGASGVAATGAAHQNNRIPESWWVEACEIVRRMDDARADANVAADEQSRVRYEKIAQWFGGMVKTMSIVTGRTQQEIVQDVRERNGGAPVAQSAQSQPGVADGAAHGPYGTYEGVGPIKKLSRRDSQRQAAQQAVTAESE